MIFDPFPVFLPSEYRVKFATDAWERREAAALRCQVFCDEQGIFLGEDRDAMPRRLRRPAAMQTRFRTTG